MKYFILLICSFVTVATWARGVCQVRHPAKGALEARLSASTATPRMSRMVRRSVQEEETQLNVVDVLIAYDASAIAWLRAEGRGTPRFHAEDQVRQMNECLEKSSMLDAFHFRLADVIELNADLSGRDLGDVLDRFVDGYGVPTTNRELRKVSEAREAVGADLVSILVANGKEGTVGVGYSLEDAGDSPFSTNPSLIPKFGDWAYNVCSIETFDDSYTLLHEIGHNMGAGHPDGGCADPDLFAGYDWTGRGWDLVPGMELGPQLFPYSSGYYLWWEGVGYYTVMAYNFGGLGPNGEILHNQFFEPLPYFSSPDVIWNGKAVGTAVNDNRRTLLGTFRYVAQYRVSKLRKEDEGGDNQSESEDNPPGDGDAPTSADAVTGAFLPQKAINGVAPYIGALRDSAGMLQGTISLKIGKMNTRKGISRVSGQVLLLDGKKYSIKTMDFPVGTVPQTKSGMVVAKLGTLELTLGASGFRGRLATTAGEWGASSATVGGVLTKSRVCVHMESFQAPEVVGYTCLQELLPEGQVVDVSKSKWSTGASPTIKYGKVPKTSPAIYELKGVDDAARPNKSGLKLSYTAKTGVFKGSFKVYYTNEGTTPTGKSPRLKKVSMSVTGIVVDQVLFGRVVSKAPSGSWNLSLQ